MLTIVSSAAAQRRHSPHESRNHNLGSSYLARLVRGLRGTVDRKFVKRSRSGGNYLFTVDAQPGDVYEARRWHWDQQRQSFMGGTIYLGIGEDGRPVSLTRDEAVSAVLNPPITHSHDGLKVPATIVPERIMPPGVYWE